MRLIDADALNNELQRRVGSPTDDKLYEVNLCIIDAPTIDAIPVAWLITQINEALDDNETELASDIDWLIRKYKNEQEAGE